MGVIKTLAVGLGIITAGGAVAMAVPEVRNKTLDWLAPHSNIYKAQEKDLADTKENLENTQKELELTKQTLAEKQSQVDTLTIDKETLTTQVNELKSTIALKDSQIEDLNNKLTDIQQELDTQTEYLQSCEAKASEIKIKIETLSQDGSVAYADEISSLQTDLESIETLLVKVQANVTGLKNQVSSLNSQLSMLNIEKENLTVQVNDLKSQLAEKNTQIENLNAEITTLNSQITKLQEQVNELSNNTGVRLQSKSWVLNDGFTINANYLGQDYYCEMAQSALNKLSESDSEKSFSFKEQTRCLVKYDNSSQYVTFNGTSIYGNDSSKKFNRVFKINGKEVTREKFNDAVLSYQVENNSDPTLQLIVNFQVVENSVNMVLDIVNFPLTGRYYDGTMVYIDFDNQIQFYNDDILCERFTLTGLVNSQTFTVNMYNKNNPTQYIPYTITIVSDTEFKVFNTTYTKVTELIPEKYIGSYFSEDGDVFTVDSATVVHTPTGEKLILKTADIDEDYADLDFIGLTNSIGIDENSDGSITLRYNRKTYTKKVEITLDEKYIGEYASADGSTFTIGTTKLKDISNIEYLIEITATNKIKYKPYLTEREITFVDNDGVISFQYNGNSFMKLTDVADGDTKYLSGIWVCKVSDDYVFIDYDLKQYCLGGIYSSFDTASISNNKLNLDTTSLSVKSLNDSLLLVNTYVYKKITPQNIDAKYRGTYTNSEMQGDYSTFVIGENYIQRSTMRIYITGFENNELQADGVYIPENTLTELDGTYTLTFNGNTYTKTN